MQKTVVIITGPTGIGKTKTGIEVATHFKTEIISADSRQIYKELCINGGSNKRRTKFCNPPFYSDNFDIRQLQCESIRNRSTFFD